MMHQRKGKKILIYFFLLILVGSINNINFNNLKLQEVKFIKVSGLGDNENLLLFKKIQNLNLDNIFFIDVNKINTLIQSNSLVEKHEIFKKYPSSIDVKIKKTKFLARMNTSRNVFLVGSNGKLIKNTALNDQLPFIFGNPSIDDFLSLKKIVDQSKISYHEIKNLYFFPSKRWDLELRNNIIIKLSDDDIRKSLALSLEILYSDNFDKIKIIDARIKNQVIIND